MTAIDLDEEQVVVKVLIDLMWPHETSANRGLALAEEAGEACRAILKREHARVGDGDRNRERDWTENLRKELAQVMIVALSTCAAEGWDASDLIFEEIAALDARREALGLEL